MDEETTRDADLVNELDEALRDFIFENEGFTSASAFSRVAATWLGYDLEDEAFVDGPSDHGIDFWLASASGFDIFQVKTHDLLPAGLDLSVFGIEGVKQLDQAKNFLLFPNQKVPQALKPLQGEWLRFLADKSTLKISSPSENSLRVTLNLVLLGAGLTSDAHDQFEALKHSVSGHAFDVGGFEGINVFFSAALYTIDDLIKIRQRERAKQRKNFDVDLYLKSPDQYTNDRDSILFYSRAVDLVEAFSVHGYVLFEANVRANISKSKINKKIRDSVSTRKGRKNFRFMNNGVTIICDAFSVRGPEKRVVRLTNPSIVNGLQTVVALHTAYEKEMTEEDKEDFTENCYVLARALTKKDLDVDSVVLATNTQNPMQARNLRSNQADQLEYVSRFAEMNWFYEHKQGAWDAFRDHFDTWRPPIQKRPKHFRAKSGRYRRVDNEILAQSWLSFVGFSREAVNERKELFEDRLYHYVFQRRPLHHGSDRSFSLSVAFADARSDRPNASLLLVSYLCLEFAKQYTRTITRRRMIEIKERAGKSQESLTENHEYVKSQALQGMRHVFVEAVGFALFRALGENIHDFGGAILRNGTFANLAEDYDIDAAIQVTVDESFSPFDLLPRLWLAFEDTVGGLVQDRWGTGFVEATVKSRYVYEPKHHLAIFEDLDQQDKLVKRGSRRRVWQDGIPDGLGFYEFIYEVLCSRQKS